MKLILARRRASNDEFIKQLDNVVEPVDYLDAAYNKLDENVELCTGRMKALTKLRLAHNRFQAFPEFMTDLNIKVSVLDLSYNRIKEMNSMKLWENASMLTKLCLQGNQLEKLPDCLGMLKSLKVLVLGDDLSGNYLKDLPVRGLANLEELSVARNHLISFPEQVLDLPRLSKLNLSRNRIEKIPEYTSRITIQHVDLSYNFITEFPRKLNLSTKLKTMDLTGNPLKYIPTDLPLDKSILSCNECFYHKQTVIELIQEFERPQLKYLALNEASKQDTFIPCPLTLKSCLEKIPSVCASCPFRYIHPYGEVMIPGVVQGHHQVPVRSEVCSQACAMGLIVKLNQDRTLCISDDDLSDL